MRRKEDGIFLGLFLIVVFLVFRDIAFLRGAFLKGDYLQQFFPWYSIYSQEIRCLHLPLWIRQVQCGFPLFAEGQIGALYPPNILFFLLLPFKAAYNYSFLTHFILAGFFVYLFARKINADFWGGAIAAALFCFGSVYAGLFVNISALKSLAWFPLVLLIFERYFEKGNRGCLVLAGLITGMQVLVGSFQMTSYALLFYLVYFYYRSYRQGRGVFLATCDILPVLGVTFLVGLPQLAATAELSRYSARPGLDVGFALWNSFSPLSLLGVAFPYCAGVFSRGSVIYLGLMGLFFAGVALYCLRKDIRARALGVVFIFSLFCALGKYNPLYALLVKLSHFYAFRAPSRFIYFGVFSLSVLGGVGFTYLSHNYEKIGSRFYRLCLKILSLLLLLFLGMKLMLNFCGPLILTAAKGYVSRNIYGRLHHRYSLESYLLRTDEFYRDLTLRFSLRQPHNILSLVFLLMLLFFLYRLMKNIPHAKPFPKYFCIAFILSELFLFNFFSPGLRRDIADFSELKPTAKKVFNIIKADSGLFRIMPFGRMEALPLWAQPSLNAFYGIDSAAFYSPLANRDYFQKVENLGIVDDSLGIKPALADNLYAEIDLIRDLNVKYVVSAVNLTFPSLTLLAEEEGVYLYAIKDYLPRLFSGVAGATVAINKYAPGLLEASVQAPEEVLLVFSEKFYPGWQAYIDAKPQRIEKYRDVLQTLKVPAGQHKVVFKYRPFYARLFMLLR